MSSSSVAGDSSLGNLASPVRLTERAATMVLQAMREEGAVGHGLRVGVIGGGCSGLQYRLDFAAAPLEDDWVAEQFGVCLFVDPYSANHLLGTVIDFVDDTRGTGFHFDNPNVAKGCAGDGGAGHGGSREEPT